jgi:SAM-dependent methyltransferase
MFSESVELYDLIYARRKDYAAEVEAIAARLLDLMPTAHDLLDVGCGTGEHARLLVEKGFCVDGIDLEPAFVEIARAKSAGSFTCADMADFDLDRDYDAVLCLFSSIGYVKTTDALNKTLASFRSHLRPGGVVIVEPWFTREVMEDGTVHMHTAQADGLSVCRMSHTAIHDNVSRLTFEYLIGRSSGLTRALEVHELGLFSRKDTENAFSNAGLTCEWDPIGIAGRGLYVGRVAE